MKLQTFESGPDMIQTGHHLFSQNIRRVLFAIEQINECNACIEMLRTRGLEVREVADGRSCLDEAKRGKESGMPFDIIVLAADLPVLDGFSTAMLLRENDYARIIISVHATDHYIQEKESLAAGCDLHLQLESISGDLESIISNLHG